jgi:cephalosporin hydroxylase
LDDILDNVYDYSGLGRYQKLNPIQHRSEFHDAVNRIKKESPNSMLEVGTAYGGSLYVFVRGVDSLQSVISIDIGDKEYYRDRIQLYNSFSDIDMRFIIGNSNHPNTKEK